MTRCVVLVLLCTWAPLLSRAELKFKERLKDLNVEAGIESVAVEYEFTNEGTDSVEIADVKTSCGCLQAHPDKFFFKPGESGKIIAEFEVGVGAGTEEKKLTVILTQGDPIDLFLKVTTPELIQISPEVLKWKVNETPAEKTMTIKILYKEPIKVTSVRCSRIDYTYELKTIEEGREYQLVLKPDSTKVPQLGVLRLLTDSKFASYKRKLAFFRVYAEGDEEDF